MTRRVVTALILLTLVISGFLFSSLTYVPVALTALVSVICTMELSTMLRRKGLRVFRRVASWGVLALVAESAFFGMQYSITVFGVAACVAWIVRMPGRVEGAFADVAATVMVLAYVGIPFAALIHMFLAGAEGKAWLLLMLFIIWASDTFALLVGRRFGTLKLWPKISPGKTVEGAAGGLAGAMLVTLLTAALFPRYFPNVGPFEWVAFAILFSLIGLFGDLAESLLKRDAGVKDSGSPLTGHGGFLDLMDSALFAAVPLLFYLQLLHPHVLQP